MDFTVRINGQSHNVDVDPEKPLLWVLREDIQLNGTKYGCGIGICGTCKVLVDGKSEQSCMIPIQSVGESEITTIEGLDSDLGKAVKDAWIGEKVSQCGYCQPGQIIQATDLLSNNPNPTDEDINDSMDNLCRCGTYQRIRKGIKTAAASIKK